MRDVNIHPFKAVGVNKPANIANNATSYTVVAPFNSRNTVYPGVVRVVHLITGSFVHVNLSSTASPVPTSADMAVPPGIVCYFELNVDTVAVGIFSTGSGVVNVQYGTGGIAQ